MPKVPCLRALQAFRVCICRGRKHRWNSEYIMMLNQAASDRQKLAELLNISGEQMSYITNADAGCGLIKYGSSLVPFINNCPKHTRLYKLMTTKPEKDNLNRRRMDAD